MAYNTRQDGPASSSKSQKLCHFITLALLSPRRPKHWSHLYQRSKGLLWSVFQGAATAQVSPLCVEGECWGCGSLDGRLLPRDGSLEMPVGEFCLSLVFAHTVLEEVTVWVEERGFLPVSAPCALGEKQHNFSGA